MMGSRRYYGSGEKSGAKGSRADVETFELGGETESGCVRRNGEA